MRWSRSSSTAPASRAISDEDILHAWRHPLASFLQDDDLIMVIGPDSAGNLLEVGSVFSDSGQEVIIHAMSARKKYLDRMR